MKLDLNIKEWVSLFGLLERQVPSTDKYLVEIHNRMKAQLVTVLTSAEKDQFERWFDITHRKVEDLEKQNKEIIKEAIPQMGDVLMDDDNEFAAEATKQPYPAQHYPKRQRVSKHRRSR